MYLLRASQGTSGKEPTCQCRRHKRRGFKPLVRKIHWRWAWQPTPVFLPGESHGQRSLAGYSPWGRKKSDATEVTWHTCTYTYWRNKWEKNEHIYISHIFNYREHNSPRASADEIHQVLPPLLPTKTEYDRDNMATHSWRWPCRACLWPPVSLWCFGQASSFFLSCIRSQICAAVWQLSQAFLPPSPFFLPIVSPNEVLGHLMPS